MTRRYNALAGKDDLIRERIAAGKSSREIGNELGVSRTAVINRARRYKLGEWQTGPAAIAGTTVPKDFTEFYAANSQKITAAHYGVAESTVARWAAYCGVKRRGRIPKPAPAPREPAPRQPRRSIPRPNRYQTAAVDRPAVALNAPAQAAHYLRRYGPVYRCTAAGGPVDSTSKAATHWRRGASVLTDAEIVDRAMRNGWDPDAWRRVA